MLKYSIQMTYGINRSQLWNCRGDSINQVDILSLCSIPPSTTNYPLIFKDRFRPRSVETLGLTQPLYRRARQCQVTKVQSFCHVPAHEFGALRDFAWSRTHSHLISRSDLYQGTTFPGCRKSRSITRESDSLSGGPRIYAGEGALQRSGKGWTLLTRFSAGDGKTQG
jgi:hypothetical protein